jgi:hypothetical protein
MKAPSTITLSVLAVLLFFCGSLFISDYYPAARRVVGADGKIVLQQDWTRYNREMLPVWILWSCAGIIAIWLLLRFVRFIYERRKSSKPVA